VTKAIHNHCFIVRASSDASSSVPLPPKSQRSRPWRDSTAGVRLWRCQTGDRFQSYQVGDIRGNERINEFLKEIL